MLNYGIIGAGAVFENFQAKSLLNTPGLNLYAVADLDKERLKNVKKKYGFKKVTTDYHDFLDDKNIDIIMVNTPQHLRMKPCCEVAGAKKHIYVEKPLAGNLLDAAKIIEACKKNRVKLFP